MSAAIPALVERLSAAYRQGNLLVLSFDYDGTLAPIVEYPWMALLDQDAEAMKLTVAAGGYALGIGPQAPPAAQYRLPEQAALPAFLESLDAALEKEMTAARVFVEHGGCLVRSPQQMIS